MNKIQKEIFEMEQELGVPSHLRWDKSKYAALLEQVGTNQECDGDVLTCLNEKCICKHNKIMEKETVEEAAEKFVKDWFLTGNKTTEVFKAGAEWRQERMYSEEDMGNLWQYVVDGAKELMLGNRKTIGGFSEYINNLKRNKI